jgi:hypothetical protein
MVELNKKITFENKGIIESDIINKIVYKLNNKLENYFIEGIRLKWFEFKNKSELENFIKLCCRCEDIPHLKQKTYFLNNIPFFVHYYEIENHILNDAVTINYG